jgi:DNA-binding NarL/FixJ family response regulator
MPERPIHVLLVEDNPADALLLREALAEAAQPIEVTHVESLGEAVRRLEHMCFDAVLLDLSLPDSQGIDTVTQAMAAAPQVPLVVLSGLSDEAAAIEAVRRGAQDFLTKGQADHHLLVRAIRYAMERKRAEEEVRQLNAELERRVAERTAVAEQRANQLRVLASELTLAEERQRRRLASVLHDHLQQLLVAARLKMALLRRRVDDDSVEPLLPQIDQLLSDSIEASRSLTFELSPPILYDGGLTAALDWLARQAREKHGLNVRVEADRAAEPNAEEIRILLFQSVRELLFNIIKHAQVQRAEVSMSRCDGQQVQIVVRDEGVGFDLTRLKNDVSCAAGFGLFSIRERLELLGGSLVVESLPGKGTSVTILAPRPEAAMPAAERAHTVGTLASVPSRTLTAAVSSPAGPKIRVLLADDHQVLREGLTRLLQEQTDIEVIAQAADGKMAVEQALRTNPDVVLMDIGMPKIDGIEATRRITMALPSVRVIGLSMYEEEDMAAAMYKAGAMDFLSKSGPSDRLLAAVRGIASSHPL